jgi:hypothetical protein
MPGININVHSIKSISAVRKENGGSTWVDVTFHNYYGESEITLFPFDNDDPRFAALAEFITATWPTEEAKAPETSAADKCDLPF